MLVVASTANGKQPALTADDHDFDGLQQHGDDELLEVVGRGKTASPTAAAAACHDNDGQR